MKNYILKLIKFVPFFKKKYFHFIFHTRRGYHILARNKNLHFIRSTKYNLNKATLNLSNFDKRIFQFYDSDLDNEKIVKQVINQKLNSSYYIDILYCYFFSTKKKFIFPFPSEMLDEIEKKDFKINRFLSYLMWIFFILLMIFHNLFHLIKLWLQILKHFFINKKIKKNLNNAVVFCNIDAEKELLLSDTNKGKYNLLNWAKLNLGDYNYFFLDRKTQGLEEKNDYDIVNDHFTLILNHLNLKKYFVKSLGLIVSILKNVILLRWWNLFLFKEAAIANLYECADEGFARKYIFIYVGNIFRPLWTYSAEKKGSKIEIVPLGVFNEISIPYLKSSPPDWEGFCIMTWPIFYSWNESSKEHLTQKTINKPEIILLNNHVYSKDIKTSDDIPKRSITVFSHEEHRHVLSMSPVGDYQTQNKNWVKSFYNDIYEVLKKNDITMVIKRKKNIGKKELEIKKDTSLFNQLKSQKGVIFCNTDISVDRLCQTSLGTIGFPFTSAAIVSNNYKKPTIFFDPCKWVGLDDPASSGIKIIYNKDDLSEWIKKISLNS